MLDLLLILYSDNNMEYQEFKQALNSAKNNSLPGEQAQSELAPMGRSSLSEMNLNPDKVRKAGVLALFENYAGTARLILTSRTEYPGAHSGQVSFPGGSYESIDQNFEDTAKRETEEEIGVSSDKYQVWGAMSPLYIPPSNFLVHPYLALSEESLKMTPEEKEVAAIHQIPFERFLAPDAISQPQIKLSNGFKIKSPAFEIDGLLIWGATAMMIGEIRRMILREIEHL